MLPTLLARRLPLAPSTPQDLAAGVELSAADERLLAERRARAFAVAESDAEEGDVTRARACS